MPSRDGGVNLDLMRWPQAPQGPSDKRQVPQDVLRPAKDERRPEDRWIFAAASHLLGGWPFDGSGGMEQWEQDWGGKVQIPKEEECGGGPHSNFTRGEPQAPTGERRLLTY